MIQHSGPYWKRSCISTKYVLNWTLFYPPTASSSISISSLRWGLTDRSTIAQGYERWHENYYTIRSHVLAALPYPIQLVVGLLVYRKVSSALYGQGTGRLSAEEISAFRQQVWESIESLLSASRRKTLKTEASGGIFWVLGGDGPSEADATVFGFIASSLVCDAYVFLSLQHNRSEI